MSLVFAGILPNILPTTDAPTAPVWDAVHELEGELYCMKPDTVLLLVPTVQQAVDTYQTTIATTIRNAEQHVWKTDVGFIAHLKGVLNAKHQPFIAINAEETIDESVAVPLGLLTAHLPDVSVMIITTPTIPVETHYQFGALLRHEIQLTNKRIAVFATGTLQSNEQTLNATIGDCIAQSNSSGMKQIRVDLLNQSHSTLLNPLATLFGIVDGIACHMEQLGSGQRAQNLVVAQIVLQ